MTPPNGRTAATNGRQLVEGAAILTPLAVIAGYLVSLISAEIPSQVQNAIVALVVVLGNLAFSELRNRGYLTQKIAPVALALPLLLVGCVTWNGDSYRRLANDEIVVLAATLPDVPLDPNRCLALNLGALALRERDGGSRSLNAPFFAGQHVEEMATIHQRASSVCVQLLNLDQEGAVSPALRDRNRTAWEKTWKNGRALLGGGE